MNGRVLYERRRANPGIRRERRVHVPPPLEKSDQSLPYAAIPGSRSESLRSQSRTTAAVQDWLFEPRGSPVNGSKYSAKPPLIIWSRAARLIRSASPVSPACRSDHHNNQLTTGHVGPRQ